MAYFFDHKNKLQLKPTISIITVVYNGESLIVNTIKSVLAQTYPNVEYIIIDGASTDNTMDVISKYKENIATVISEKDSGIYDAMNKGLDVATGDYVLFINAGDEMYSPTTVQDVFSKCKDADVYYGSTTVINTAGDVLGDRRLSPPENLTWKSFKLGMSVSHQSFIAKKTLCEHYSLEYKLASDIDWVIKILKQSKSIINVQISTSKFLEGGITSDQRSLAWKERFKVLVKHYGFLVTLFNHIYIAVRFILHKFTRKSMT